MALKNWIVVWIGLGLCAAEVHSAAVSPPIADFQKRVADYMKVRSQAAAAVPSLKIVDSMGTIDSHAHDLQLSIRAVRPTAAQGDIFTPAIAAQFHRIIRHTLGEPGAAYAVKNLHDTQPSLPQIAVNGAYPAQDPVAYMPPSLLDALPPLPKGLEYRAAGHTLMLCDIEANLIVDYMPNALP